MNIRPCGRRLDRTRARVARNSRSSFHFPDRYCSTASILQPGTSNRRSSTTHIDRCTQGTSSRLWMFEWSPSSWCLSLSTAQNRGCRVALERFLGIHISPHLARRLHAHNSSRQDRLPRTRRPSTVKTRCPRQVHLPTHSTRSRPDTDAKRRSTSSGYSQGRATESSRSSWSTLVSSLACGSYAFGTLRLCLHPPDTAGRIAHLYRSRWIAAPTDNTGWFQTRRTGPAIRIHLNPLGRKQEPPWSCWSSC